MTARRGLCGRAIELRLLAPEVLGEPILGAPPAAQPGDVPGDVLAVERVDPRGLADLSGMHGVAGLHRRGGRGTRVEHLLPPRAVIVAPWGRALLDVDGAVFCRAAELLGGPLDALREHVAEPFPPAHHLEQAVGPLDIAPLELEAELIAGDVTLLLALHDPAAQPAPLVDVDTGPIAFRIEPGDAVAVGGADRPAASGPALVLGLVDDLALLVPVTDHRHAAG